PAQALPPTFSREAFIGARRPTHPAITAHSLWSLKHRDGGGFSDSKQAADAPSNNDFQCTCQALIFSCQPNAIKYTSDVNFIHLGREAEHAFRSSFPQLFSRCSRRRRGLLPMPRCSH